MKSVISEIKSVDAQVIHLEKNISKIHDERIILERKREHILQRFSLLKEHISLKFDLVQKQLEDFLKVKISYEHFIYLDFQPTKVGSYRLCTLLIVSDSVKGAWNKGLLKLKRSFSDCMPFLNNSLAWRKEGRINTLTCK